MVANKVNKSEGSDLFRNPYAKVVAAVTGVAAIFGIGYGIGVFKQDLDSKVEKMQLMQDCAEKVQKEINNCRETKLEEYGKSVNDLKTFIIELKKK